VVPQLSKIGTDLVTNELVHLMRTR
jgi:hypothetical protein